MARKKITSLLGKDVEYSKQFSDTPEISAPVPSTQTEEKQESKPTAQKTTAEKPAEVPKPKLAKSAQTNRPTNPPKPNQKPTPKVAVKTISTETRAVHVRAVPKTDHKEGLDRLQKAGLPATDVVRLAGKRAIEKFELQSEYVAPEQAERLPTDMSFRTMKTLSAAILDALRDQADPLRLRSDAAVIQGQLEPIFWKELDALIKELSKQYV